MAIDISKLFPKTTFDNTAWCNSIAFHDFALEDVKWKEWFNFVVDLCARLNIEPNKLGMHGEYYGESTYYMSFKGGKKKLEKFNFEGISNLTVTQIIPNEAKEYWDGDFTVYFSLYPSLTKNDILSKNSSSSIVLCIDEKLMPFNKEQFGQLACLMQEFTNAKYGYYYKRRFKNNPHTYSLGSYEGKDEAEKKLSSKWQDARCGWLKNVLYATGHLRDIYPLNFLSSEHLNWQLGNGKSLEEWIVSNPDEYGKLQQLTPKLYSWSVAEDKISSVRQALAGYNIIVTLIDIN